MCRRPWAGTTILAFLIAVSGAASGCGAPSAPSAPTRAPSADDGAAGPQADITCPAGAVRIATADDIQAIVDAHPGSSVFCLEAGVHHVTRAVTPKTGNTFMGEPGAVLDGSGWQTSDATQAAFRAHNEDIDRVTIRNLVIRNMPQKGIHAFSSYADGWTIEYNELAANGTGLNAPRASLVRHNAIHDNIAGGYSAYQGHDTRFEQNDIYRNGGEQKIVGAANVVFRSNHVHDNAADGIWYDTENTGSVIEANTVADNGRTGISYESSGAGIIRNNTVRRNGGAGVLISTSKHVRIDGNTLEDNGQGVQYFLDCAAVAAGGGDLADNSASGNVVVVGAAAGSFANAFNHATSCSPAQVAPYSSGAKRNVFAGNTYVVTSLGDKWWIWGRGGPKSWAEWQALGHDTTGKVELRP